MIAESIETALRERPEVLAVEVQGSPSAKKLVVWVTLDWLRLIGNRFTHRLKFGDEVEIAYYRRSEAEHFHDDIFVRRLYLQHGIVIPDGACVFDVGANIGMFSVFAASRARDVTVFTFEPAPPLREILCFNLCRNAVNAHFYPAAVGSGVDTARLTFYPNSPGMSSLYADRAEEEAVLLTLFANKAHAGDESVDELLLHRDELLAHRFRAEQFDCPLTTVSTVIAERQIERIDLLKIDVQKAELDVLLGVRSADWQKIQQVVLEVHDIDGRLDAVRSLLGQYGFHVAVEQDPELRGSILYNIYARRTNVVRATAPTFRGGPGRAGVLCHGGFVEELRLTAQRCLEEVGDGRLVELELRIADTRDVAQSTS